MKNKMLEARCLPAYWQARQVADMPLEGKTIRAGL
jgi:hypothetical protein